MVVDRSQSLFFFVPQDILAVKQVYVIYINMGYIYCIYYGIYICYIHCIYYGIYIFVISIVYIDSDKRGSRPLKTQLMRLLRAKSTLGCSQELIMSQISFANIFVANILEKIFVKRIWNYSFAKNWDPKFANIC